MRAGFLSPAGRIDVSSISFATLLLLVFTGEALAQTASSGSSGASTSAAPTADGAARLRREAARMTAEELQSLTPNVVIGRDLQDLNRALQSISMRRHLLASLKGDVQLQLQNQRDGRVSETRLKQLEADLNQVRTDIARLRDEILRLPQEPAASAPEAHRVAPERKREPEPVETELPSNPPPPGVGPAPNPAAAAARPPVPRTAPRVALAVALVPQEQEDPSPDSPPGENRPPESNPARPSPATDTPRSPYPSDAQFRQLNGLGSRTVDLEVETGIMKGEVNRLVLRLERFESQFGQAQSQLQQLATRGLTDLTVLPAFGGLTSTSTLEYSRPERRVTSSSGSPSQVFLSVLLDYDERVSSIASELKKTRIDFADRTERLQAIRVEAGEFQKEAQGVIDRLGKEEDDLRVKQAELETEMRVRDADLNQLAVNKLLVYAVYGMIVAIVSLFGILWLLSYFAPLLASLILEKRVLMEVLSMGFLLLTVIILGTGKQLNPEGIAALLGTIAGYIFARKAGEEVASRISSGSVQRMVDTCVALDRRTNGMRQRVTEIDTKEAAHAAFVAERQGLEQRIAECEGNLASGTRQLADARTRNATTEIETHSKAVEQRSQELEDLKRQLTELDSHAAPPLTDAEKAERKKLTEDIALLQTRRKDLWSRVTDNANGSPEDAQSAPA